MRSRGLRSQLYLFVNIAQLGINYSKARDLFVLVDLILELGILLLQHYSELLVIGPAAIWLSSPYRHFLTENFTTLKP